MLLRGDPLPGLYHIAGWLALPRRHARSAAGRLTLQLLEHESLPVHAPLVLPDLLRLVEGDRVAAHGVRAGRLRPGRGTSLRLRDVSPVERQGEAAVVVLGYLAPVGVG